MSSLPAALTDRPSEVQDSYMAATVYDKTMERAFRLLSYKPRSVAEMRERLLEKEWAEEPVVDQVINRLKELGYLDDKEFARQLAASRLTIKPLGRTRLRFDLKRRKLQSETIEQALDKAFEEKSEEDLIEKAIVKRIRLKGVPRNREESKKLFDFLMRRGFSYELVRRKIHDHSIPTGDEDEA